MRSTRFNGRLIGEIGDDTLSSFHSAVDAVNCAREIQASLASDGELGMRIGIHVGDLVFANNTVLGDGVNAASRIHELAPPGGSCISERVYRKDAGADPDVQKAIAFAKETRCFIRYERSFFRPSFPKSA